jgi:amidase
MDVRSYRPDPELCWTFGGVPPVRRVRPGTVLELWTEDAFGGKVRVANVVDRYHVSEHL